MRFGESLYLRDLVDWGKAKIDIVEALRARDQRAAVPLPDTELGS